MAKIDSISTGSLLPESNEDPSPSHGDESAAATAKKWGLAALDVTLDANSLLFPFDKQAFYDNASDLYQWSTHDQNDLAQTFMRMTSDPKKTMASMDPAEASWCMRHFSDQQRQSVLNAFETSGLTKKTEGQTVPAGAPKPPALYEVNDRQPTAVKEFIHGANVIAARNYDDRYDLYARTAPNPDKLAPYVNLEEPGSHGTLEEDMSRTIARGVDDYVVGKLHDAESAVSVARQTRKLSVGDEMQLQLGFDGAVDGASLGASAAVKVKRSSDGYHVSPQGTFTGGAMLDTKNRASGSASCGCEYRCKTVNEVDQLTTILARQDSGAPLSKADRDFLGERVIGLDLKATSSVKFNRKMNDDVKLAAGLKAEESVHLDLESHTLTVSRKISADASGQLSSHQGSIAAKPDWKLTNSLDSGLGGDVTVIQKYSLPPGISWEDFKANPSTALAVIAQQANQPETSVKVHLQAGNRAVDVEGKAKDVDLGALVAAVGKDGVKAAARQLVEQSHATVKVDRFQTGGIDIGPKLGGTVDSFTVSLKAQRTHHDVKQVGSLKEAFDQLTAG